MSICCKFSLTGRWPFPSYPLIDEVTTCAILGSKAGERTGTGNKLALLTDLGYINVYLSVCEFFS